MEKMSGLMLSGPKSHFWMKTSFGFHLEGSRFWENGFGETEDLSWSWSSVKFPLSVVIWRAMFSACFGQMSFYQGQSQHKRLPGNLRALHVSL